MAFMTTQQVAERLNVPVSTLRRYLRNGWVKAGKLPGQTIYRFSQAQVKQAMDCFEEGGIRANEVAQTNA